MPLDRSSSVCERLVIKALGRQKSRESTEALLPFLDLSAGCTRLRKSRHEPSRSRGRTVGMATGLAGQKRIPVAPVWHRVAPECFCGLEWVGCVS